MLFRNISFTLLSVAVLALPSAAALFDSVVLNDWRKSGRFYGTAYLVSSPSEVADAGSEGSAPIALLATLLAWQDWAVEPGVIEAALGNSEPSITLAGFSRASRELGAPGVWMSADLELLAALPLPAVALMADSGGTYLIVVRDVRAGYVYAARPLQGNLLYPVDRFSSNWTGRLLVFDPPLAQPQEWR